MSDSTPPSSDQDRILEKLDGLESKLGQLEENLVTQMSELETRVLASFQARMGDILHKQFETELITRVENLPCDLPEVKSLCHSRKNEWASEYLNFIISANWDQAHRTGKDYQHKQRSSSDDGLVAWSQENPQCKLCAAIIEHQVLENQLQTLEALYSSFYSRNLPSKVQDLDRIDPEELYEEKISPLANKIRVVLLILIFRGFRRFNELKAQINASSSTTDHHLKKLMRHGLIIQDNKTYRITPDGVLSLNTMLHLSGKPR